MQSALSVLRRFPPPSSGTDILAWLDGSCTRLATDAWITLVLQLVIRHMVFLYILLHILFAPVDEWVHLNQVVDVIPFHHLHILSGHALLLSQSADPYVETLHRPLQRFQFSNLAAAVSAFYRIIEEVDALFLHHLLYRLVVREEHFQVDAVRQIGLVDELVGLRKESSCIKCEDAGRFIYLHDDVGKCLVLDAEGRRKSDAPFECLQEITDNILGRRIAEFLIEFRNESF